MHHLDANKTHGDKVRKERHKNATWCLKQISKASPNITAAVWPFTSHLPNHTNKQGARGVMVIITGNGHGDTSSNLGRD